MTVDKSTGEPDTRQKLLHAAEQIFAAKGFDGSRVGEIAARAGVNIRMLYHHFGSKEGLYHAVVEGLHQELEREQEEIFSTGTGRETLFRALEAAFAFLRDNPNFVRISGWNMLAGERARKVHSIGIDFAARFIKPQLDRLKSSPGWNDRVDSMQAIAFCWCLTFMWFLNREDFIMIM